SRVRYASSRSQSAQPAVWWLMMLMADAFACCIEFTFHMLGSQMHIPGGGVHMRVAQQRLHHRQIDARGGQHSAERVPQCVRMPASHATDFAVIPENSA